MNIKYTSFLILSYFLLNSDESFASKARLERGASCTDNCTKGGKFYTSDLDLAGFGKNQIDITANFSTLQDKVNFINKLCKNLNDSELVSPDSAGNVNWCDKKCTDKGGLLSQLKGRQKDVLAFVSERKNHCKNTMELYAQVFHQVLEYDANNNILTFKPNAQEVFGRKNFSPPPPSDMPPPLKK